MLGALDPPTSLGLVVSLPDQSQRCLTLAELPPDQRARLHQQVADGRSLRTSMAAE